MTSRAKLNAQDARPSLAGQVNSAREHWPRWADTLRRYQLDALAALLLEAGGPFVLLATQALYAGRPFLSSGVDRLINLLESDDEAGAFADYLENGTRASGISELGDAPK